MEPHHAMPTRRTVLRTAVWSAPVIAVAAAAPAFAASVGPLIVTLSELVGTNNNGNNNYRIVITFTGGDGSNVTNINVTRTVPTPATVVFANAGPVSSTGGSLTGANGTATNQSTDSYTITYTFNGLPYSFSGSI